MENFKDSVDRYEAARSPFEGMGVRFRDIYWTLGSHDIVSVVDAPDSEPSCAQTGASARRNLDGTS